MPWSYRKNYDNGRSTDGFRVTSLENVEITVGGGYILWIETTAVLSRRVGMTLVSDELFNKYSRPTEAR